MTKWILDFKNIKIHLISGQKEKHKSLWSEFYGYSRNVKQMRNKRERSNNSEARSTVVNRILITRERKVKIKIIMKLICYSIFE